MFWLIFLILRWIWSTCYKMRHNPHMYWFWCMSVKCAIRAAVQGVWPCSSAKTAKFKNFHGDWCTCLMWWVSSKCGDEILFWKANRELLVGYSPGLSACDLHVLVRQTIQLWFDLSMTFLWVLVAVLVCLSGAREHTLALLGLVSTFYRIFCQTWSMC